MVVVHETWYCPELKIVILETNDDPRSGETRNELVNIVRGEPDVFGCKWSKNTYRTDARSRAFAGGRVSENRLSYGKQKMAAFAPLIDQSL